MLWNAPLANGIPLTVATGCALVLFGVSVGLVVAAVCCIFVAVPASQPVAAPQESYASISDDEIEIVIELVHDALATGGWTLCGDCYARTLLQRLQLPIEEYIPAAWEKPISRVAASPHRVDGGAHPAQNTPASLKNGQKQPLRVEQGTPLGRVPTLTY